MAVDGKAGVRLKLFASFVAVGGMACLAWAGSRLSAPPSWLHVTAVTGLVAVATVYSVRLRIRGEPSAFSCSSAALLLALAILPGPWAVICVTAGVLVTQVANSRFTPVKVALNTAAHAIGVTAAYGAVVVCGLASDVGGLASSPAGWIRQLLALLVAAIAYAIVDESIVPTAIALIAGLSWRAVVSREADVRSAMRVANLLLTGAAIAVLDYRVDLVLALPLAVVTVHLASSQRLRVRAEQRAGQQLALATAALAGTDPAQVAQRAALAAIRLLSAAEAEIETTGDGARLVRVRADNVVYDGPALDAPPAADADTTAAPLVADEDSASQPIGFLRLRFKAPTPLNDSEQDTLRTFAGAVSIALANATAYQSAVRVAGARDHDATHDALTGLGNRRALEEYGALLGGRSGLYAVALVDLNHFKQVNDTLGHTAGDLLLVGVARRLAAAVEPTDLVTRLGGDEFAVVLTELAAPAHGLRRAQVLLEALAEPIDVHGIPVTVEAAVGLAGGPVVGGLPELLRRADLAMYQAKRQCRTIVVYQPERHTVPTQASADEATTAGRASDTRLTYQPIVDLGTAQIVGARAVTSWQRFRHMGGLRQEPVEQTGAGPAYTNHLLGQVLHAAAAWRAAGFDLPVAVHVPARSLLDPGFVDAVADRMASTATPLGGLTIELTETLVHSSLAIVRTALRRLVDLGVRLALDEFGATSSPLGSLAHAPIHEITISRALVNRLADPEAIAITRSVLDLGRNLDLQVTADGVESEAQRIALWELGCTAGRGSLFGKSLAHERLLDVLRGGHDGRPGSLGAVLHQPGTVIRLTEDRRAAGNLR
jgi:diguanylate cyclase (GGDEF)-like protein